MDGMRRFALPCLALLAVACSDQNADENDAVDTTLNDVAANSEKSPAFSGSTTGPAQLTARRQGQKSRISKSQHSDEDSGDIPGNEVVSATSATARGDIRTIFTGDDYPASAQAAGAEGIVQAQLTVGPTGAVIGCNIIRSAGNGSLDSATCNILRRRAHFTPARDSDGNPTTDTVITPPIVWRLEG
jgi:TonB family protein